MSPLELGVRSLDGGRDISCPEGRIGSVYFPDLFGRAELCGEVGWPIQFKEHAAAKPTLISFLRDPSIGGSPDDPASDCLRLPLSRTERDAGGAQRGVQLFDYGNEQAAPNCDHVFQIVAF